MRRLIRDDGTVVCDDVEMATGIWPRFMGLMGRRELPPGHALYLRPCNSIHMFFMRFPIDAVFLDASGAVLRMYEPIKPWRVTVPVRKAKACLELRAGTAAAHGLRVGDVLRLEENAEPQPAG